MSAQEVGTPYRASLIDYSTWAVGQAQTNQIGFPLIGDGNVITTRPNPVGVEDIVWASINNDVASDADGGWITSSFTIDNTKMYRYSVWIRRENSTNGQVYLGPADYNTYQVADINGTPVQNPYWYNNNWTYNLNQWYLFVGFVYPSAYVSFLGYSQVYDTSGARAAWANTEYKWAAGATYGNQRSFLYYSTDPNSHQFFYRPRVDLCDGTEPTIGDLIACRENPVLYTNTEAQGLISEYTMNSSNGVYVYDRTGRYTATTNNLMGYNSNFTSGIDSWNAYGNETLTSVNGVLVNTVTGTDPYFTRYGISFSGTTYPMVRVRFRQTAGTAATQIRISNNDWTQFTKVFTFTALTANTWYDMDFDMTTVDSGNWVGRTVNELRFDFPNVGVAGQVFEIASIRAEPAVPTLVDGKKGKAFQFNGTSQYLSLTLSTSISAISVWFKHNVVASNIWSPLFSGTSGGYLPYLGLGNGTGGYPDESLMWNSTGLLMVTRLGETFYKDGKWHHLVISIGGENGIWVDGVAQSVTYAAGSASTNGSITPGASVIGREPVAGNYYFTGQIGDMRFYNRNLNQTDVNQLYNTYPKLESSGNYIAAEFSEVGPTRGLLAYYNFDSATSSYIPDASGNGNNGTCYNTPTFTTMRNKRAITLNGTNQYFTTPLTGICSLPAITVSFWMYRVSDGEASSIFLLVSDNDNNNRINFHSPWSTGEWYWDFGVATGGAGRAYGTWNAGWYSSWHLYTLTAGMNGLVFYVDSVAQVSSSATTAQTVSVMAGKYLQWGLYGSNYVNASLADIHIYNRALNTKEISTLYNLKPSNLYIESNGIVNTSMLIES